MSVQSSNRSYNVLLIAGLIGGVGGLLGTAYFIALKGLLNLLWMRWMHLPFTAFAIEPTWRPLIVLVTTIGGLVVGLLTRWLGSAGEIAAVVDNIHMEHGRIDPRQTPSMVLTSLVSITAGGSAGPEAPLVQTIGSFGSWIGDRFKLDKHLVRTCTFCGMAAALGAFFGAPLGGALFALEIPHRRGIEYYESLLPAIVSALAAFFVFRLLVGYEQIVFHINSVSPATVQHMLLAIVLGGVGAAVGWIFSVSFATIHNLVHALTSRPVLLGALGGLVIGLFAQLSPITLFWSEMQMDAVIEAPTKLLASHTAHMAAMLLILVAMIKILTIGATLHSGFRGGFIFPLMFVGASLGAAISLLLPAIPRDVAVLSMMAAVNVAITKTPISTTVMLTTLTGTTQMPVIAVACITSLLLTTRVNMIRTQRERSQLTPVVANGVPA